MNESNLALRDVHLPTELIGLWPLAWGWWVLIGAVCLLLVYSIWWWYRRYQRSKPLKLALAELEQLVLQSQQDSNALAVGVSALLRRVAISLHGRARIAGLAGEAWLQFLRQSGVEVPPTAASALLHAPYCPSTSVDSNALVDLAKRWIHAQKNR